ncbi:MAG: ABC transporter substrate-binding protein, partial [Caulobacterales bacterium]|nr:ABC transporter substrate-binding protein [Caulobacterales bacterium]
LVTFADDPGRAEPGVFRMGVAPTHAVPPILRHARGQGVRRVAVIAEPGPWGERCLAVASIVAPGVGVEITSAFTFEPTDDLAALPARLRAGGRGYPDAVLLPDGGAALARLAMALRPLGFQLLGTIGWAGRHLAAMPSLHGAWFTAPDPTSWSAFTEAFQARTGVAPGLMAGLAFDAAIMARALAESGEADRDGVLRQARFPGAVGDFGFREDGSCMRDLAVLAVEPAGVRVVARPASI